MCCNLIYDPPCSLARVRGDPCTCELLFIKGDAHAHSRAGGHTPELGEGARAPPEAWSPGTRLTFSPSQERPPPAPRGPTGLHQPEWGRGSLLDFLFKP